MPPKKGITEIQNISLNKQTSIVYLAVPTKTKRNAGHEINFFFLVDTWLLNSSKW